MADIDGTVTITRRTLPSPTGGESGDKVGGTGTSSAVQLAVQQPSALRAGGAMGQQKGIIGAGAPFEHSRVLFFRAGEAGVRWIPQVGAGDLL